MKINRRLFIAQGAAFAGSLFIGHPTLAAKTASTATAINIDALKSGLKGQAFKAGDSEFRKIVFGGLWNQYQPTNRAPDVVVRVANDQDVIKAVKFAKENGLKIAVRGGGHNWCAPSIRQGGMMIDLGELNQVISIDEVNRKAVCQPVVSNREIQRVLNPKNLAYPSGHCPPVKLSGYLLSGGMSWNQGVWGHGIEAVDAIDLVTSDGELITASKDQNPDYFWAARGAGPGFFGIAVRYHLSLFPLPKFIGASSYAYSMNDLGTVADWLGKTAGKLPPNVELSLFLLPASPELADKCKDSNGKMCLVTASTFADSEEECKAATKLLDECPIIDRCLSKTQNEHVNFEKLFDMSGALWPEGLRCQVEAMFSNSEPKALYASVKGLYENAPSKESVLLFAFFTGPNVPAPLPNSAFSMSARFYGGMWTQWKDASADEANLAWHKKVLAALKPHAVGHYIAESDTVSYPKHVEESFSAKNYRRLQELRKKYDPHGLFFDYYNGLA